MRHESRFSEIANLGLLKKGAAGVKRAIPGVIEHMRSLEPNPLREYPVRDVLVSPKKAARVLSERTGRIAGPAISQRLENIDQENPSRAQEIILLEGESSWLHNQQRGLVLPAQDIEKLFDRKNNQPFSATVGEVIDMTIGQVDYSGKGLDVLGQSYIALGAILDLMAILNHKIISEDDAVRNVAEVFAEKGVNSFYLGMAVNYLKNPRTNENSRAAIRADAEGAERFEHAFMQRISEDERVQFKNGSFEGEVDRLSMQPLHELLVDSEEAKHRLSPRTRRVLTANVDHHIEELELATSVDPQEIQSLRDTRFLFANVTGGVQIHNDEVNDLYSLNRNMTFGEYVNRIIDVAVERSNLNSDPTRGLELIGMFGELGDFTTLLQPGVNRDAGFAIIFESLRGRGFPDDIIESLTERVLQRRLANGEIFLRADTDFAEKFQRAFAQFTSGELNGSEESQPTEQSKWKLIRRIIHKPRPRKVNRSLSSDTHEAYPTSPDNRPITAVLINQDRAKDILSKRARHPVHSPTVFLTESGTYPIQPMKYEIPIFETIRRSRTTPPKESLGGITLDSLFDPANEPTFGTVVNTIIQSSIGEVDRSNGTAMLTQSITMFRDIFTLLALVDSKAVSFEDAARTIIQALPPEQTDHRFFGRAIDWIKNNCLLGYPSSLPPRADAETARKFQEVYINSVEEELKKDFIRGTIVREEWMLDRNLLIGFLPEKSNDAVEKVTLRKRNIYPKNVDIHSSRLTPERSRQYLRETKTQRQQYHDSVDGLGLTAVETSGFYTDTNRGITFINYISNSIANTLTNLKNAETSDPMMEYMHMFGRFFDVLALAEPSISFEAGAACIINVLSQCNFTPTLMGMTLNYIRHLQYPSGEFYERGDKDSAQRFIDIYSHIVSETMLEEFNSEIDNNRYNIYLTQGASIRAMKWVITETNSEDIQPPYQGESLN